MWILACAMAALLLLAALPAGAVTPIGFDIVVATNGSDAAAGTFNKPFATVHRAQEAVRELRRKQPQRRQPIRVLVRAGTYFLARPLVFTPEDSGTAEAPVIYMARKGDKVVLSGGRKLSGWKAVAGNRWELSLPEVARGDWYFSQLYANGERRSRPRLPKSGYYFVAGEMARAPDSPGAGFDRFRFRAGDLKAGWHNPTDVEVLAIHIWSMSRMRLKDVDEASRVVRFTGSTYGTPYYASFAPNNRYLVENVREALDEPGEWYLDRKSGVLTYLPRPGETPEKTAMIAPRLERLLELKGDVAGRRWVEHVRFEGLTFAHNGWNAPPEGNSFPQAEVNLGAAVHLEGARDCSLTRCTVTNTATYGVEIGQGSKRCRLEACELTDLGAGGIKIGETARRDDEEAVTSHNVVRDCHIGHGGRIHPAGIGVWIGHSHHNTVAQNDIHDFYYSGISAGWSWGYGPSHAHHNTFENNHVHTLGQGVLSDMGGIYLLGVSPGTVVRGNRFHDVSSFDYGGWGIYFDEGTTGVVAENNVTQNTKTGGFHQHYGRDNVVRNNIIAFDESSQIARTRHEEHRSFTFERNIVYWDRGALLRGNWNANYVIDHNLYGNAGKQPLRFGDLTWEQWRAKGNDTHSVVADPGFVAPRKGDFRLRADSPAAKIGFRPWDLTKAGRLTRTRETRGYPRAFPPPPPPPPPLPIAEGLEDVPVGEKVPGAATHEENAQATARVTEEAAATGKRALKFTDAAGQQNRYNPHVHFNPAFVKGVLVGRFALRHEPGAVFYHEWRDNASPYHAGPSLRVEADGSLTAGGKTLTRLPHGQWVRFEIACGLGDDAGGTYDLIVRPPGRAQPHRFPGLPCSPAFKRLDWWGFVADAAQPAVFYLDDLALGPR